MPARTIDKKANIMAELASHIPRIFDQAQNSTANHHKNFVALHKLHAEAALHTEATANGSGFRLTGEHAFEDTFIIMVAKVLPVKKGASQGDRIVKFVGGYTRFVNERGEFKTALLASISDLILSYRREGSPSKERGYRR